MPTTQTKDTKKALAMLKKLASDDEKTLESVVAQDALDRADEGYAIGYLLDVTRHGCQSGTCSGLIYYVDTHKFYNEHADEIDGILEELEDMTGEAFKFEGRDVRNTLAWLGYEETARKILDKLGIED